MNNPMKILPAPYAKFQNSTSFKWIFQDLRKENLVSSEIEHQKS